MSTPAADGYDSGALACLLGHMIGAGLNSRLGPGLTMDEQAEPRPPKWASDRWGAPEPDAPPEIQW